MIEAWRLQDVDVYEDFYTKLRAMLGPVLKKIDSASLLRANDANRIGHLGVLNKNASSKCHVYIFFYTVSMYLIFTFGHPECLND